MHTGRRNGPVDPKALGGAVEGAVTGSRLCRTGIATRVINDKRGVTQAGIRDLDCEQPVKKS